MVYPVEVTYLKGFIILIFLLERVYLVEVSYLKGFILLRSLT